MEERKSAGARGEKAATTLGRPLVPWGRAFEAWGSSSMERWRPARFPTADGGEWVWAEPGAEVRAEGGCMRLSVRRFTRSHDVVQIFDNPKHLLACRDSIPVPDEGLAVEATMTATIHGAPTQEWADGFASLNLMDFEHGLVLDGLANDSRTAILFERLEIPGIIPRDTAWTTIADGPPSPGPGAEHRFRLAYWPAERRAMGWVDGKPVMDYRGVPFRIKAFTPGLGLITLRPIEGGRSRSLLGQGATGTWGPIQVGPASP